MMQKIIILLGISMLLVLVALANARAEVVVNYKACAGGCWQYPVTSYSLAEMKKLKPAQFCYAQGIINYIPDGVDKDGNEKFRAIGNFHGYFMVEDCKKMSNLKPESAWWFQNPTLIASIDACRASMRLLNPGCPPPPKEEKE
jgi:hypothetical protein